MKVLFNLDLYLNLNHYEDIISNHLCIVFYECFFAYKRANYRGIKFDRCGT